jgi:hypothetical protein
MLPLNLAPSNDLSFGFIVDNGGALSMMDNEHFGRFLKL